MQKQFPRLRRTAAACTFTLAMLALAGCQTMPAVSADAAGCPIQGPHETARVIDGFAAPESVLVAGRRVFVSNIGAKLDPLAKDGDGFISELDRAGNVVRLRAFPAAGGAPLHAPKGMALAARTLYVADIDRVVGFDLASGAQVFEATAPGKEPALLNDLAAENDGTLLVTDTLRGTVARLDIASGRFTVIASHIAGANGIAVDAARHRAWVVGIGAKFDGGDVHEIALQGAPAAGATHGSLRIAGPHGLFDGVAFLPGGMVAISDWRALDGSKPGDIALYAAEGTRIGTVHTSVPLLGPADFHYDATCRQLWVPGSLSNQVQVVNLP
ncbi:MAG: hypothetical protein V4864_09525 [Pseudomonadota bacterium]